MRRGLRAFGGLVAVACALSLSGAAALPEAQRATVLASPAAAPAAAEQQPAGHLPADLPVAVAPWPDQTVVTAEMVAGPDTPETVTGAEEPTARLTSDDLEIPSLVLEAYQAAADRIAAENPSCGLRWEILAGIGKIESDHARGGRLTSDGDAVPRIIGPVLNGVGPVAAIRDTDGGRWDGDAVWDRAVGPMQFIPGTWRRYGVDGSGNGEANPHNIWDATLSAGYYLCAGGADLTTDSGLRSALLRYNRSTTYVANVIRWINAYADGTVYTTPDRGPGRASPGGDVVAASSPTQAGTSSQTSSSQVNPKPKASSTTKPKADAGTEPSPPSRKDPTADQKPDPARDPDQPPSTAPTDPPRDPDDPEEPEDDE